MSAVAEFPRAFAVRFKDLDRWDPMSFHRIRWHWPAGVMRPIGSVLTPRKAKIDRVKVAFADLQPVTIHFDGSIDKRSVDASREYTMDLFAAEPGDIVVAKIDLKNGAVAIVPDDWTNVAVTGHFAVYEPDRSRLIPEYLHLIVQAPFFKAHLWRNKVGAEGRKEVKLDFFEAEPIPLPSISVQQKIVDAWQAAKKDAAATAATIARLEREIESGFLADLGLKAPEMLTPPKALSVCWKDFLRWSVSYNQFAQVGMDLSRSKYSLERIGSMAEFVQYGTSEKANASGDGTAVIRMNNVVDGALDLGNLKHARLSEAETARLMLRDGDILFNRTNSKELVGKCAVFHEHGQYIFASYLIRVRLDTTVANPDFVAFTLNSPIGRQQIDALSRQIIGQANVNSEELRSLECPLPALGVQDSMMKRIDAERAKVARLKSDAKVRSETAKADIEAMILGAKPVS